MIEYFCEKLGCQLKPFIKANPAAWRREIDKWFPAPVQSAPEKQHSMEALRLIRITEDSIECEPHPDILAIDQAKLAQKFLFNFRRQISSFEREEGKLIFTFSPPLPSESDAVIWMKYYKSQKE